MASEQSDVIISFCSEPKQKW